MNKDKTVKLEVLKALMDGTITKDEAKTILKAESPTDYFYLDTDKEDKAEYHRIKELMERVGFFPPVKFVGDE